MTSKCKKIHISFDFGYFGMFFDTLLYTACQFLEFHVDYVLIIDYIFLIQYILICLIKNYEILLKLTFESVTNIYKSFKIVCKILNFSQSERMKGYVKIPSL